MSSLAELADGVLLPGFVGRTPPRWLLARVAGGLGGVVLFARNIGSPEQLAGLTAALHAERPGLLIGTDEEGGDVTRLDAATGSPVPSPLALGVVDDTELTRAVHAATARRLAAAGVTLNLAPVADVNSNPDNPVIGVRSFGADPELVARQVAAAVAGTQAAGVIACAKHFPGHGDTAVDSHLGLPTVTGDLTGALLPFRAAVDAGVGAIMTGHLRVPAYDELPATVSPVLIDGLLRGELGYRGLVISDALEMAGVAGTVGIAKGAVLALLAGVDALCIGGGLADEAIVTELRDAIVDAVRAGQLPEDRLAEAGHRVTTATTAATAPPGAAGAAVPGEAARIGLLAARRAIRSTGAVSLPAGAAPVLVELHAEPGIAVGATAWGLAAALEARAPGTSVHRLGPADPVPDLPTDRPLVVVTRDAARVGWQRTLLAALLDRRPDAVVVEMGLPGPPPPAAGYLVTHGAAAASAQAAADALTAP